MAKAKIYHLEVTSRDVLGIDDFREYYYIPDKFLFSKYIFNPNDKYHSELLKKGLKAAKKFEKSKEKKDAIIRDFSHINFWQLLREYLVDLKYLEEIKLADKNLIDSRVKFSTSLDKIISEKICKPRQMHFF